MARIRMNLLDLYYIFVYISTLFGIGIALLLSYLIIGVLESNAQHTMITNYSANYSYSYIIPNEYNSSFLMD